MKSTAERTSVEVSLAKQLDRARRGKGLTVTELARRIGTNRNHLGQRFNGTSAIPVAFAQQLAETLGYTLTITLTPKDNGNGF